MKEMQQPKKEENKQLELVAGANILIFNLIDAAVGGDGKRPY